MNLAKKIGASLKTKKLECAHRVSELLSRTLDRSLSPSRLEPFSRVLKARKSSAPSGNVTVFPRHLSESGLITKTELQCLQARGGHSDTVVQFSLPDLFQKSVLLDSPSAPTRVESILVEFGSPNIAKPLHPGHMRSLIHGSFISRLLSDWPQSRTIQKICYYGDWGRQTSLLLGEMLSNSNEDTKMWSQTSNEASTDSKYMLELYVRANADPHSQRNAALIHGLMERFICEGYSSNMGDLCTSRIMETWTQVRNSSILECESVFSQLGVEFDRFDFESEYVCSAHEIVKSAIEKQLAVRLPDGAVQWVSMEPFVLEKADGSSLYIGRDVAALAARCTKFEPSAIYYVVDSSQSDHFNRLFEVHEETRLLGDQLEYTAGRSKTRCIHVPFGKMYNLSTRRGPVVLLNDIIDYTVRAAVNGLTTLRSRRLDKQEDIIAACHNIAMTHLKIADTLRPRLRAYEFSVDELKHHKGLAYKPHYCHARLKSLELTNIDIEANPSLLHILNADAELRLMQHLMCLPDFLDSASMELEAYGLTHYLINLCELVNVCLSKHHVKNDSNRSRASARLALYHISGQVIRFLLGLHGVEPLNKL